jgi:phosphate transport system protein
MDATNYARQAFQLEIRELEHDMLEMGSLADMMVSHAVEALCALDVPLAVSVMNRDDEIDVRELDIESRCLRLLALQNPMASDLRVIGTVMKVVTDIERVGDLAVDIARIALKIDKEMGTPTIIDLPQIAHHAQRMFRESLESFVRRDLDRVYEVARLEVEVDEMYRQLREQLFADMRRNSDQVVADSWLFTAIQNLERIADHAVNVAERVAFIITGQPSIQQRAEPVVAPAILS